jgi:hypothetical protein
MLLQLVAVAERHHVRNFLVVGWMGSAVRLLQVCRSSLCRKTPQESHILGN